MDFDREKSSSLQSFIKQHSEEEDAVLKLIKQENSKEQLPSFHNEHSKSQDSNDNLGVSFRMDRKDSTKKEKISSKAKLGVKIDSEPSSSRKATYAQYQNRNKSFNSIRETFEDKQRLSYTGNENQTHGYIDIEYKHPNNNTFFGNQTIKNSLEVDSKADNVPSIDKILNLRQLNLKKGMNTTLEKHSSTTENKGIFWTKETVQMVWDKFRQVKEKVKAKKKEDFEKLSKAITMNDEEYVLSQLKNPKFKLFYNDCLYRSDLFLEALAKNLSFDTLQKVLEDKYYQFDHDFCFKYILILINIGKRSQTNEISNAGNSVSRKKSGGNSQAQIQIQSSNLDQEENDNFIKENPEGSNRHREILTNLIKYELYTKEKSKVKILAWFLADFQYYEAFLELVGKHEFFSQEKDMFNNFLSHDDIKSYCEDRKIYHEIIENCLINGFQELAIQNISESSNIPEIAARSNNLEFLQYIWENSFTREYDIDRFPNNKNSMGHYTSSIENKTSRSFVLTQHSRGGRTSFLSKGKPIFSLSGIVPILKQKSTEGEILINRMLKWKGIEYDEGLLNALLDNDCFEQVSTLISSGQIHRWQLKKEHFQKVIEREQAELVLFFVTIRDCRIILSESEIQKIIVNKYMRHGEKLYYGAEMLVYIYKNQWKSEFTKDLCKNIIKTIKTKDILNCHSSILTCLLLCEFLSQIKEISITNVSRCEKVMNELKEYCKNIQESNPQESYIRYLMKQKDTRGRPAFQIASENSVYELLETAEIGTIVKKMWNGNVSNNGYFAACSMYRYLDTDAKTMDPFMSFDTLDINKVYFFQLAVWTDSCSLRYWPESLSTLGLIITYNVFIYLLVSKDQLFNTYNELDSTLKILLWIYISWVSTVFLGIINMMIFVIKSKRRFKLDVWTCTDIILFIFALLLLLDTRSLFQSDTPELTDLVRSFIWDIELMSTTAVHASISYYTTSVTFIIRTLILTINDILVWIRVTGILLTFKEMGPVIRMIMRMALLLLKYLLIIVLFLACCAAIFTAIFNRYSSQFQDFSTSIVTLFGGFVNNFQTAKFDEKFKAFGSVMVMTYVCIAGVLLVNLLIAVLANVYEKLSRVVDASHRAVLIQYYRKYKWDTHYGYLIFLASPLNVVNYIVLVFSFCWKSGSKKFNVTVTKMYHFVFYFPLFLSVGMVSCIAFLPFCYIKGLILMVKYQIGLKIVKVYKVLNVLKWLFAGLPYLFYVFFRDIWSILKQVFKKVDAKDSDFRRIKKNITTQDVIIFLKFIHSTIPPDCRKDIHTLFMAYLDFESSEKAEMDEDLKQKKAYLKKINSKADSNKNQMMNFTNKTVVFYNNNSNNGKDKSLYYPAYIRKNLMVIEILENFVIDDELGSCSVDIEKMRKLLPLTMNIKNYHIRRLVHSDAHALNQAMTKLKVSKNVFLQYQLVNKIMASAIRLDKEIDSEIFKIQRNKNIEQKKDEYGNEEKEEEESVKSAKEKREELDLMKKFEALISKILEGITETINSKKKDDKCGGGMSRSISENDDLRGNRFDSDIRSSSQAKEISSPMNKLSENPKKTPETVCAEEKEMNVKNTKDSCQ